jgi:hypothetical protein
MLLCMPAHLGQLDLAPLLPPPRSATTQLPVAIWRQMLARPDNRARYAGYVITLREEDCFPWAGSISSAGAGCFWARADQSGHSVSAHKFGYHLERGTDELELGEWRVVRHTCDNSFCQNPAHWIPGGSAENLMDWQRRRHDPASALNDLRGPRGRAVAVRNAALLARDAGLDAAGIAAAVRTAMAAGMPPRPDALF